MAVKAAAERARVSALLKAGASTSMKAGASTSMKVGTSRPQAGFSKPQAEADDEELDDDFLTETLAHSHEEDEAAARAEQEAAEDAEGAFREGDATAECEEDHTTDEEQGEQLTNTQGLEQRPWIRWGWDEVELGTVGSHACA